MSQSTHRAVPAVSARPPARSTSRAQARVAVVLATVSVAFLLFDAVIHLMLIRPVVDSFTRLGYPLGTVRGIAVVELICLALYVIPRTSILGAVLLTGYLGGAVSAHVRVESPIFSTVLFPVYVGIAVWGALYLRDARLRALFPLRTPEADA